MPASSDHRLEGLDSRRGNSAETIAHARFRQVDTLDQDRRHQIRLMRRAREEDRISHRGTRDCPFRQDRYCVGAIRSIDQLTWGEWIDRVLVWLHLIIEQRPYTKRSAAL